MPPVQLVEEVSEGTYAVCEAGRAFLNSLAPNLPLAVVVVAGRYRTGKSFLLNRGIVNAPVRGGFATGSTVKACTKGVWLHPSVLTGDGDAAFVVLDTEGTASMEASLAHDAKLLGIVLALASVFVFNSVGAVDETALSELGTVTAVASDLARVDGQLWSSPQLVWALRDFTLELQDETGRSLSPDEYLEMTLDNAATSKADVRAALKAYFPQRRLVTLVRPCTDEAALQKLNSLAASTLRPEFKKQLDDFRAYVRSLVRTPKCVGGEPLDGAAVVQLAEAVVAATNAGTAPSVQSTFGYLQERRCGVALEEALQQLAQAEMALEAQLPVAEVLPTLLPMPAVPDFVRALPESCAQFDRALSTAYAAALDRTRRANGAAAERFVAVTLDAVGDAASDYDGTLAQVVARLGAVPAMAAAAPQQLHRVFAARLEARLGAAERALTQHRTSLELSHEELATAQAVSRRLRDELEEVALQLPTVGTGAAQDEAMAALRADVAAELRSLTGQRDAAEAAAAAVAAQAEAAALTAAAELRAQKDRAHDEVREALAAAAVAADPAPPLGSNEAEAAALEELRTHFEALAGASGARASQAEAKLRATLAQLAASEEAAAREVQEAQERCRRTAEAQEQERREAAARLAQRTQLLRESYDAMVREANKSRDDANASERRVLLLEVERESLKRRAEALQTEAQDVAKSRRLCEELRERSSASQVARDEAVTALELERRQLQKLEATLRETQQAAQQRDREAAFRIARLEVELAARGGPSLT